MQVKTPEKKWPKVQKNYVKTLPTHQRSNYNSMYDYQRGYLAGINVSQRNSYWRWSDQVQRLFWNLHQYEAYRTQFWSIEPASHVRVLGWSPNYQAIFFDFPAWQQQIILELSPRQSDMFWGWNNYDLWDYFFELTPNQRGIIMTMTASEQQLFWTLREHDRRYIFDLNQFQRKNLIMLPRPYFVQAMSWPTNDRALILNEPDVILRNNIIKTRAATRISQVELVEIISLPVETIESASPKFLEAHELAQEAMEKWNDSIERINVMNAEIEKLESRIRQLEEELTATATKDPKKKTVTKDPQKSAELESIKTALNKIPPLENKKEETEVKERIRELYAIFDSEKDAEFGQVVDELDREVNRTQLALAMSRSS